MMFEVLYVICVIIPITMLGIEIRRSYLEYYLFDQFEILLIAIIIAACFIPMINILITMIIVIFYVSNWLLTRD